MKRLFSRPVTVLVALAAAAGLASGFRSTADSRYSAKVSRLLLQPEEEPAAHRQPETAPYRSWIRRHPEEYAGLLPTIAMSDIRAQLDLLMAKSPATREETTLARALLEEWGRRDPPAVLDFFERNPGIPRRYSFGAGGAFSYLSEQDPDRALEYLRKSADSPDIVHRLLSPRSVELLARRDFAATCSLVVELPGRDSAKFLKSLIAVNPQGTMDRLASLHTFVGQSLLKDAGVEWVKRDPEAAPAAITKMYPEVRDNVLQALAKEDFLFFLSDTWMAFLPLKKHRMESMISSALRKTDGQVLLTRALTLTGNTRTLALQSIAESASDEAVVSQALEAIQNYERVSESLADIGREFARQKGNVDSALRWADSLSARDRNVVLPEVLKEVAVVAPETAAQRLAEISDPAMLEAACSAIVGRLASPMPEEKRRNAILGLRNAVSPAVLEQFKKELAKRNIEMP